MSSSSACSIGNWCARVADGMVRIAAASRLHPHHERRGPARGAAACGRGDAVGVRLSGLGALPDPRTALLFSMEAQTSSVTIRSILEPNWRMLGSMEALVGVMLFGLSGRVPVLDDAAGRAGQRALSAAPCRRGRSLLACRHAAMRIDPPFPRLGEIRWRPASPSPRLRPLAVVAPRRPSPSRRPSASSNATCRPASASSSSRSSR